jgi:membrane protease YdiL (CAAX protease family)
MDEGAPKAEEAAMTAPSRSVTGVHAAAVSERGTPSSPSPQPVPQYSLTRILAVWTAAAVPMGVLAWIVTPWLGGHIGGRDPFIDALMICLNLGLLGQLAMVLLIVRREQGSLAWPRLRDALWLRAPRDPRTGRRGGKVWWWALFFTLLSVGTISLPIDPAGPLPRDLPKALVTERVEHYFHGNWAAFGLLVAVVFLAPIVEELLFRGLLLPRMRGAFGRGDFVASATLYTVYHLHQPWSMPATLIDGIVNLAYPTRRFRSTWMGLIAHTAPSFVIFAVVLRLVLG